MLIIGDKEVDNCVVTVRTRESADLGMVTIDAIFDTLRQEIESNGF